MSIRGNGRRCSICYKKEVEKELYSTFPLNENRCKEWLRVVGNPELVFLPIEKLNTLRFVCSDHFEKKSFNKKGNRLRRNAVPKLNLSNPPLTEEHFKEFPFHVASYTKVQSLTSGTVSANQLVLHNLHSTCIKNQPEKVQTITSGTASASRAVLRSTCINIQPKKVYIPATSNGVDQQPTCVSIELNKARDALEHDHHYFMDPLETAKVYETQDDSFWKNVANGNKGNQNMDNGNANKRKLDPDTETSPRKRKLVERLRKTKCTLASLRRSAVLVENLESPVLKEMVINANKNQARKPTGRRWTTKNKISCLAILKRSPKTYRYLRHIIPLPTVKTLQNVLNKIPMKPGINKSVIEHLVTSGQNKSEKEKVCALLFDEMALKPRLLYNSSRGNVEGFQDFGSTEGTSDGRSSDIADHALVFMLQGIYRKFKQPIAFYFVKGTVSTEKLTALVKEIITAVNATGYKVLATVCDQGPTNIGAINLLKKFSVPSSPSENSFFLNGQEIFVVYDIPHLFKSLRNNFLKNGFLTWNGKKANWSHLKLVEEKNRNFLYLCNISPIHVLPKYRAKMRVKYAAQMLSNTVAAVLKLMSEAERDNMRAAEVLETAKVVQDLDRLFDFTNGPSSAKDIKRGLRQNVSQKTKHLEEWAELEKKLKTVKFLNRFDTVATNVKCVNGYLTSIKSLRGIWLKVRQMGFKHLNLRQLNQDSLENLFGVIRQHSPTNHNPTCTHFMGALKTAVITGLTAPHSSGSNCQKDRNLLLTDFHNLVFGTHQSSPPSNENEKSQSTEDSHSREESHSTENSHPPSFINAKYESGDEEIPQLSLPEGPEFTRTENDLISMDNQPVVYVSGYLAAQITGVHKCENCRNILTVAPDTLQHETDETYSYIRLREWWDDKKSLTYPSKNLCYMIKCAKDIMETDICQSLHRNDVHLFAVTLFNAVGDTSWYDCASHKNFVLDKIFSAMAHLFIRRQCERLNQGLELLEEPLTDAVKRAQQQGKAK